MEITNVELTNANNKKYIKLALSKDLEVDQEVVLLERCKPDIWVNHRRSYSLEKTEDNNYIISIDKILKNNIQYDELVIFDVKIKNKKDNTLLSVKTNLTPEEISNRQTTIFGVYGKSAWEFYRNNSNAISLRLKLSTDRKLFAILTQNTEDIIEFKIDKNNNKAVYYFARQSNGTINNFDAKITLTKKENNILVLKKSDLLRQIKHGDEVWRIIEETNNKTIYFSYDENNQDSLHSINEIYSFEFSSEKGKLRIVVKENIDESYNKIKICVIGSCYARLIFRSMEFYNKDYKKFYDPVMTIYHMSIPSIVSDKITYNEEDLVGSHQKDIDHYAKDNFVKDVFERLKKEKPDYVVMDNYASFTNKLIETIGGEYIDENFYLRDCEAFNKLKVQNVYNNTSDEFFDIFKDSVELFKEKFEEIMPLNKIVLVRAQPALKKLENGKLSEWGDSQTIKTRRYLWNKFDNYFISMMPDIKIIDLRDEKYISEKSSITQFQSNHLNSAFYRDAFNKLNEIVLLDKLKK